MTVADWFLLLALILLALGQIAMGVGISRWLKDHERIEFARADTHHKESQDRLATHEERAIGREDRAIERDRNMAKLIEANNANTRAAIDMRIQLRTDVSDLKVKVMDLDARVDALEVVKVAR